MTEKEKLAVYEQVEADECQKYLPLRNHLAEQTEIERKHLQHIKESPKDTHHTVPDAPVDTAQETKG